MAILPLDQGIPRFQANEDRLDIFVNGNDTTDMITSGGQGVPSIRKIVATKQAAIDGEVDAFIATKNAEINASVPIGKVASRALLKAANTSALAVNLTEPGREGLFLWHTGEFAARITADPQEGVYIPSDSVPSSTGAWVRIFTDKVDVRWFGAQRNDASAFVTNTVAIAAALNSGFPVHLSGSKDDTYHTQAIVGGALSRSISGEAKLLAAGVYADFAAVLRIQNADKFVASDISIDMDLAAYTKVLGLHFANCIDVKASRVKAKGFNAIFDSHSEKSEISDCVVTDFLNIGIRSEYTYDAVIFGNYVRGTKRPTSFYGIQAIAGKDVMIFGNNVADAYSFGINVNGSDDAGYAPFESAVIFGNIVRNCGLEGINVSNITRFSITGNVCEWTDGSSRDFGISAWGAPGFTPAQTVRQGTIAGNTVFQSGKAGIALCNDVAGVTVSGNTVGRSNMLNGSDVFHKSGILVYGLASQNIISGNNITDPLARLNWAVSEENDGTGDPNNNTFVGNRGAGTLGHSKILGATSDTGRLGYGLGSGGAVVQSTNKGTAVTLNKQTGRITTHAGAIAANGLAAFKLNDSLIAAEDLVFVSHVGGGTIGAYSLNAVPEAGGVMIYIRNLTAVVLGETLIIGFAVVKSAAA